MTRLWLASLAFVVACHANNDSHLTADSAVDSSSGSGSDASTDDGWTMLISRSWSAPSPYEGYRCRRIQVDHDMWISGFRAIAPLGTHHEVITLEDTLPQGQVVGDYDCTAGTNVGDLKMLYAAGVETDDLVFPAGVAIHVAAGQYININLHMFNATDNPISGNSGVSVKTVAQSDVQQEADMTFAGTFNIVIPPHQSTTAVGGCTVPSTWHVFALWPHMHQAAVHQKLALTHAGTTQTPLDVAYSFFEQKNYVMPEMTFAQGDQIQVTCSYTNTTGSQITFGDSSQDEMCFTGLYKYPAGGGEFGCVH